MKVVFLSASGGLGGSETALLAMLKGIRQVDPSPELHVIAGQDGPLLSLLSQHDVTGHVLPFGQALAQHGEKRRSSTALSGLQASAASAQAAMQYTFDLRKRLHQLQPELVHSNGIKMHLLSAWCAPASIPVIWHIHDYVQSRPQTSRLLRVSAWRPSAAITNSYSVGDDLRRVCPALRARTIYNAVDTERFSPSGTTLDLDSLCSLESAAASTVRIGLLATFAKWKGHRVFLQALALLKRRLPIRAYIIGGPIYQTTDSQCTVEELRHFAAELGIADRVGFTGFVQDTPAAIRALDIVVHASTEPEPFGMVLPEAMACERPVIVSFAGGAREVAGIHPDNPVHQPGDFAQLAAQMESLAADPLQRAFLGQRGRTQVMSRFSVGRLGAELLGFYSEVLSRKKTQPQHVAAVHGWPLESEGR